MRRVAVRVVSAGRVRADIAGSEASVEPAMLLFKFVLLYIPWYKFVFTFLNKIKRSSPLSNQSMCEESREPPTPVFCAWIRVGGRRCVHNKTHTYVGLRHRKTSYFARERGERMTRFGCTTEIFLGIFVHLYFIQIFTRGRPRSKYLLGRMRF